MSEVKRKPDGSIFCKDHNKYHGALYLCGGYSDELKEEIKRAKGPGSSGKAVTITNENVGEMIENIPSNPLSDEPVTPKISLPSEVVENAPGNELLASHALCATPGCKQCAKDLSIGAEKPVALNKKNVGKPKKTEGKKKEKEPASAGNKQELRNEKGQFNKGQSGNPDGKVLGTKNKKSFLDYWQERWEKDPKEFEKFALEILKDEKLKGLILQMVDGRPSQQHDLTSGNKPIPILGVGYVPTNDSNGEDSGIDQED